MGDWSIRTTGILSINGHTYNTSAGSRRWAFRRSDRIVAGYLPTQFTGRVKERQYYFVEVRRHAAAADTNDHTDTHTAATVHDSDVSISGFWSNRRRHSGQYHWH